MSEYDEYMAKLPSGRSQGDGTPGSTLSDCVIPGVTRISPEPIPGGSTFVYFREPQPPPGYRPVLRLLTLNSRTPAGSAGVYTDIDAPRWFAAFVDPFDMQEVAPELAGSTAAQLLAAVATRLAADVFVRIGAGVTATVRRDNEGIGLYPPPSKSGRWWGLLVAVMGGSRGTVSQGTVSWEYRRITGTEGGG